MNTSQMNMIGRCRSELTKESIIKSLLCGAIVGLSVCFIVAFVTWFVEFKGLWLSVGLGLGLWVVASVLFYFFKFKPTNLTVMQRIDRAGMDERMITMYELRNDDSFMAKRQREDAEASFDRAVKNSNGRLVKIKIATAVICVASIVCGFALGMTVVTGLSDYGVIPHGSDLWNSTFHPADSFVRVNYIAGEGGSISGDTAQRVKVGGTTTAVTAVPEIDDGYYFKMWVDDNNNEYYGSPYRMEFNVNREMTMKAVFEKIEIEDDPDSGYYYDPNNDNDDDDSNTPPMGDPGESDTPPEGPPNQGNDGPGGGDATDPGNTIIDGETQYQEQYEYYYNLAMQMLANGSENYPPELVAMIEAYFGILL